MKKLLRKGVKEGLNYREAKELFRNASLEELYEASMEKSLEKTKKITFYKNAYVPVSITGYACSLNCKHCNRHYLRHMIPAPSVDRLVKVCENLKKRGVEGIVLSGGSRRDGTVPLDEFADGIKAVRELGLKVLAHTGPINERQVKILEKAGLTSSLLDVVGSGDVAERVFGIKIPESRYKRAIELISESSIGLAPHVIVGLDFGRVDENSHELKALEMLRGADVDTLVIVVLIPTKGTAMQNVKAPDPEVVGRITAIANLMHDSEVALSCVRPGTLYRKALDENAILAGATKVAIPSSRAYEVAERIGRKYTTYEMKCCGID